MFVRAGLLMAPGIDQSGQQKTNITMIVESITATPMIQAIATVIIITVPSHPSPCLTVQSISRNKPGLDRCDLNQVFHPSARIFPVCCSPMSLLQYVRAYATTTLNGLHVHRHSRSASRQCASRTEQTLFGISLLDCTTPTLRVSVPGCCFPLFPRKPPAA